MEEGESFLYLIITNSIDLNNLCLAYVLWTLKQEFSINELLHQSDYIHTLEEVTIWSILFKDLSGIILVVILFFMKVISETEN